jgi:mono/diheme cytochrome c family protein
MKKALKIAGYLLGGLAIVVLAGVLFLTLGLPNVGPAPADYHVSATQEKIEHGKYLAYHVLQCVDCHSKRDFSLFSGPPVPGTEASGGEIFDKTMGFPGTFISPNITPFGIGEWTDGELFRLITTGVKKDGNPIFPIMPYHSYGKIDPEDIEAVIAYIRTLDPVPTNHPKSNPDFPFSLIMRTLPAKANLTAKPKLEDQVAYGAYMVTASACGDCHTKFENGAYVGEWLAGGREFEFPTGILRSANLTPHTNGLGNWTEDMFVQKFKAYENHSDLAPVGPSDFQTIMPWYMYSGMKEVDIRAIYQYLRSLSPVDNPVEKFSANKQGA